MQIGLTLPLYLVDCGRYVTLFFKTESRTQSHVAEDQLFGAFYGRSGAVEPPTTFAKEADEAAGGHKP